MAQTPDYTRYSYNDLIDVERRINKALSPERYALVVQEIEKRKNAPKPKPVDAQPVPDGAFLKLVRFCGGFVLGGAIAYLAVRILSLFTDAVDALYPALHYSAFFSSVGCAIYFVAFQQECGKVREEFSPTEETPRILKPSAFQNWLSGALRFCGGGLLTAIATVILWLNLVPAHGPDYGDGIGYGMAMLFWTLVAGCVGGVVFICLPLGRKRRDDA